MSITPRIDLEAVQKWGTQLVSYLFTIAGGIVSVITIIVMLTSKGSRLWVKHNPYLLLTLLVAAIVIVLVLLNRMQIVSGRYSELRALTSAADSHVSEHDLQLARETVALVPLAGPLIRWLRREFSATAVSQGQVEDLAEAARRLSYDPLDFDDSTLALDYLRLQSETANLSQKIRQWTSLEAGETRRIIPAEWEFDANAKYRLAETEIQEARNNLIRAYDRFLRTCQGLGLSTG